WVKIEALYDSQDAVEDEDYCAIRVRPAPAPAPDENNRKPAHFFTQDATSTFYVRRTGLDVSAAEKGRNEIANTETDTVFDKVRNKIYATGASYGIAHLQWKTLVNGFLKK
ncbi:MAG TPA: hypothetical protein VD905_17220, partial [Flavobacteriales bacterium]|nr:hypothetical protein [Flavobacteriales bacterium]